MNTPPLFTVPALDSKQSRRRLLTLGSLGALALSGLGFAQTSGWPTGQVKIVTGWTPGGNADAISRRLAE